MNALFMRDFGAVARRRDYFVLRSAIAIAPLLALIFATAGSGIQSSDGMMIVKAAAYAFAYFVVYAVPAFTAAAIAEEKRADAIDVLRTTPLGLAGIVVWKFAARLGILLSLWFLMLPLAALGLLIGGVAVSQYFACVIAHFFGLFGFSATAFFVGSFFRSQAAAVRWAFAISLVVDAALGVSPLGSFYSPRRIVEQILLPMTTVDWTTVAIFCGVHFFLGMISIPATIWCLAHPRRFASGPAKDEVEKGIEPTETSTIELPRPRRPSELWSQPLTWIERIAPGRRRLRIAGIVVVVGFTVLMDLGVIIHWAKSPEGPARDLALRRAVDFARIAGFFTSIALAVVGGATIARRDIGKNFADVLLAAPIGRIDVMKGRFVAATAGARFVWMLTAAHTIVTAVVLPRYLPDAVLFSVAAYFAVLFAATFGVRTGMKAKTAGGAVARSLCLLFLWGIPAICCALPLTTWAARRPGAVMPPQSEIEVLKFGQIVVAGHCPLAMPFMPGHFDRISIIGTIGAAVYAFLYMRSTRTMIQNTYPGDEWRDRPESKVDRPPLRL